MGVGNHGSPIPFTCDFTFVVGNDTCSISSTKDCYFPLPTCSPWLSFRAWRACKTHLCGWGCGLKHPAEQGAGMTPSRAGWCPPQPLRPPAPRQGNRLSPPAPALPQVGGCGDRPSSLPWRTFCFTVAKVLLAGCANLPRGMGFYQLTKKPLDINSGFPKGLPLEGRYVVIWTTIMRFFLPLISPFTYTTYIHIIENYMYLYISPYIHAHSVLTLQRLSNPPLAGSLHWVTIQQQLGVALYSWAGGGFWPEPHHCRRLLQRGSQKRNPNLIGQPGTAAGPLTLSISSLRTGGFFFFPAELKLPV